VTTGFRMKNKSKANEKYPAEALVVTEESLADMQARYEYLLEHEEIMKKMKILKQTSGARESAWKRG
jgi:hypothetical protein